MRRSLTTVTALLAALVTAMWAAAPAQAHEGVNITIHTDGAGKVWGVVSYTDGHPVTGAFTLVFLAASPDGATRVGPTALQAASDQQNGVVTYEGQLKPGTWRVSMDMSAPGIASCIGDFTVPKAGESAAPQEKTCAASFWPTPGPAASDSGDGGSLVIVAVIAGAALLALGAIFIAMRARRDRAPVGKGNAPRGRPTQRAGRSR
jgi:hypothetical protein